MKPIYRKYLKVGALIWAVCFIVLLLYYFMILAPQENIRRVTEKNLKETRILAQSAREAAQEENKNLISEKLTNSKERLKDFIIEQKDTGNLTLDISRIAGEVNIRSLSSDFTTGERTTRADNFKYINTRYISVNFSSSFNKFAGFLNRLERSRPVYFIDTFSITRSAESGSGHPVDMKLAVFVGKDAITKGVDG